MTFSVSALSSKRAVCKAEATRANMALHARHVLHAADEQLIVDLCTRGWLASNCAGPGSTAQKDSSPDSERKCIENYRRAACSVMQPCGLENAKGL